MLIDFHTHLFPDKIAARALKKLEDGMIRIHGYNPLPPHTDGTLSGLLDSMNNDNVDMSIVMPIATTPTQSATINAFAKEITDNERIISFGSLHPRQPDWEKTLEEIKALGLKGIKLHPEFQDFYVDEPVITDIVKKAEKLGLLVLFHSGEDLGYLPPVHCTPERLRKVLDKTDCKNIIAAHFGAFKMWEGVKKHLAGTPVIIDTSMANGYLDKDLCREIISLHGAENFVFGSDNPWQSPKQALDFLQSLELPQNELEMIKHKNAERILGL